MTEAEIITIDGLNKRMDTLLEKFGKLAEEIKKNNKKKDDKKQGDIS